MHFAFLKKKSDNEYLSNLFHFIPVVWLRWNRWPWLWPSFLNVFFLNGSSHDAQEHGNSSSKPFLNICLHTLIDCISQCVWFQQLAIRWQWSCHGVRKITGSPRAFHRNSTCICIWFVQWWRPAGSNIDEDQVIKGCFCFSFLLLALNVNIGHTSETILVRS